MKAELTASIEKDAEGGFWAICPEFPGANGQGNSTEETKESLKLAVELIVQDRLESYCSGLSKNGYEKVVNYEINAIIKN